MQPLIGIEYGDLAADTVWLTAVYPQSAREQIEPYLEGIGEKLIDYARLQGEGLRAMPFGGEPQHQEVKTWWGRLTDGLLSRKLSREDEA